MLHTKTHKPQCLDIKPFAIKNGFRVKSLEGFQLIVSVVLLNPGQLIGVISSYEDRNLTKVHYYSNVCLI